MKIAEAVPGELYVHETSPDGLRSGTLYLCLGWVTPFQDADHKNRWFAELPDGAGAITGRRRDGDRVPVTRADYRCPAPGARYTAMAEVEGARHRKVKRTGVTLFATGRRLRPWTVGRDGQRVASRARHHLSAAWEHTPALPWLVTSAAEWTPDHPPRVSLLDEFDLGTLIVPEPVVVIEDPGRSDTVKVRGTESGTVHEVSVLDMVRDDHGTILSGAHADRLARRTAEPRTRAVEALKRLADELAEHRPDGDPELSTLQVSVTDVTLTWPVLLALLDGRHEAERAVGALFEANDFVTDMARGAC